ncbi:MAG: antibiotic biosynthesis monooxygenase family protein [Candidatus Polarisedimenticolia bacterium]
MYVLVWEFRPRRGREAEFEAAYGPEGEWVRLFRTVEGYLGTELHRDTADSRRYLTIDRWSSRSAYESFRAAHREAYEAIDRRCVAFTEKETPVGSFEAAGGDPDVGAPDGGGPDVGERPAGA